MVSEVICLAILRFLRGHDWTLEEAYKECETIRSTYKDASAASGIYRNLLPQFGMANIDSAIRWLELVGLISRSVLEGFDFCWYILSDKGRQVSETGVFPEEERRLLYQEHEPYHVFMAHQFKPDDTDLVTHIREKILSPLGFVMVDGRVEGLQEFRTAILTKMKRARFFLCLLTKRHELTSGEYASSVWLYQETGAAVALGKKPLLLVEEGVSAELVGELQSIYEHIGFTRSNHPARFEGIGRRFLADLHANDIPIPPRARPADRQRASERGDRSL